MHEEYQYAWFVIKFEIYAFFYSKFVGHWLDYARAQ